MGAFRVVVVTHKVLLLVMQLNILQVPIYFILRQVHSLLLIQIPSLFALLLTYITKVMILHIMPIESVLVVEVSEFTIVAVGMMFPVMVL